MNMARPIRETPILVGKDAERFVKEMKRVDSLTPEQRRANREKLHAEVEEINKKWNLTYNALLGCIFIVLIQIGTMTTSTLEPCTSICSNYKQRPQVQASSIGDLQLRFLDYHKTGKNEIKRLFNLTSIYLVFRGRV